MSVGFGQILVILFLLVLLFGNVPNLMKDLVNGIQYLKQAFKEEDPKAIEQKEDSMNETSSKRKAS
jgi:Sec-independent protein translocase protein TatA